MKTKEQNDEGAALVVVLSFTLLAVIFSAALLAASGSQTRVAGSQLHLEQALYVAEAGFERAAQHIEDNNGYLPATTTDSALIGEGTYTYTIKKAGWRSYSVESVGTVNGISRVISVDRAYLPTYAQYALWMHENGVIYFIGGEEFFGHVHSNDILYFADVNDVGPWFHEECSTSQSTYGGDTEHTIFEKGFQQNAQEGQMADVDFVEMENLADNFGLVLDGETEITFVADDGINGPHMKVTNPRQDPPWVEEIVPIEADHLIYIRNATDGDTGTRKGKVQLNGGEVDGRLTIVSDDDMRINDHIRYQDANPGTSDDALGLISKDDVWVTQAAPNNLDLHAAVLATGQYANNRGSFGVLKYYEDAPRGTLNVMGSIVQDKRGAVGTFNGNGPSHGYVKNYAYDPRFIFEPPPYYPPIADKVAYTGWKEEPYY